MGRGPAQLPGAHACSSTARKPPWRARTFTPTADLRPVPGGGGAAHRAAGAPGFARDGALLGAREDEHAAHRAYAQHHLGRWVGTSPFIRRAQQKPPLRRRPRDDEHAHRPHHTEGGSLFAKVINLCAATEVAARANINRISFLTDKIRFAVRRHAQSGRERTRICSIGCGPPANRDAAETELELGPYLDVMLIDQDVRAINFCERNADVACRRTGAWLHYVRESVRRLCAAAFGAHDGAAAAYLQRRTFDYLSDRSFAVPFGALYEASAPVVKSWSATSM